MTLETIIDGLNGVAQQAVFYLLMGSFGFLSIIIVNGIIRSGRKDKRNMNKS
ncbi:MAG TPA: hypothetical protein VFB48_03940 [Nitrososphaeraceae archaeon]|jgi:hypothetical protein|nr:hypothetical protein [Nitrososphaeraceae archaeon]